MKTSLKGFARDRSACHQLALIQPCRWAGVWAAGWVGVQTSRANIGYAIVVFVVIIIIIMILIITISLVFCLFVVSSEPS